MKTNKINKYAACIKLIQAELVDLLVSVHYVCGSIYRDMGDMNRALDHYFQSIYLLEQE